LMDTLHSKSLYTVIRLAENIDTLNRWRRRPSSNNGYPAK